MFDKSRRRDGTFSRSDFAYDHDRDLYICPGGNELRQFRRPFAAPRDGIDREGLMRYRATKHDCDACSLKPRCCPKEPARKLLRSIHEGARDMALACLSPRIVEAIADGTAPADLTLSTLTSALPHGWTQQEQRFLIH